MLSVSSISSEEAMDIRNDILRPGRPRSVCTFDGDNDPTTRHFGIYLQDDLIGICTFIQNTSQHHEGNQYWQLRGMAITTEHQGKRYGEVLLIEAIKALKESYPQAIVWGNMRLRAISFYDRLGFEKVGPEFEVPDVGPHYIMIESSDRR